MSTTKFDPRSLRHLVHPLALLPLALLIFDALTGGLTANPIQDLTLRTGEPALILLILTLACTPLSLVLGWKWIIGWRRSLGLYSFLYVCLHLLVFVLLDYGVDLELITQAVIEKRYVLAGFAGFLLMLPLALTSTKGSQRRLGRNWRLLHRLTYVAAIFAVLHFLWLSKIAREPLIYGAILAILLLVRVPAIRHWISTRRRTLTSRSPQS